jgi:hypothetical protein
MIRKNISRIIITIERKPCKFAYNFTLAYIKIMQYYSKFQNISLFVIFDTFVFINIII